MARSLDRPDLRALCIKCFELRVTGMNPQEISEHLQLPLGTVRHYIDWSRSKFGCQYPDRFNVRSKSGVRREKVKD